MPDTYEQVDEVPEPRSAARIPWDAIAEEARNTDRWVVVPDVNKGYQSQIRNGLIKAFREGEWMVSSRRLGGEQEGHVTLYIKHVPF